MRSRSGGFQVFRPTVAISFLMAIASMVLVAAVPGTAIAAPSISPYGEVARFGGFDSSATYSISGAASTTGLTQVGEPARFVYPIGMAVDTKDPNAPDEYAIYILENINPQALDAAAAKSAAPTSLSLEYRIQKVSDEGVVLASTMFTLTSTASEPGLHAAALTVDGPADRLYVLLMDVPSVADNTEHYGAADAIDAWTTGRNGPALEPAVGLVTGVDDDLPKDTRTGAGELVGPASLQSSGSNGLLSDIDGASITPYQQGGSTYLALAGNRYTSETKTTPVIELIDNSGKEAGKIESDQWNDIADTEDIAAKEAHQASEFLYAMSSDQNGSLNVTLGGEKPEREADLEPNMVTVGTGSLSPTTALLPSSLVSGNFADPAAATVAHYNEDASATMALSQDMHKDGTGAFMPSGATENAGVLAPSVTELDGGAGFPSDLYAGVVAREAGEEVDRQNPTPEASGPKTPPSWKEVVAKQEKTGAKQRTIESPASLGIRIFDENGESLGMIGNTIAGGACNIQSSPPSPATFKYSVNGTPSFVALAAGREGIVFALVQPDLLNVSGSSTTEVIAPDSGVGREEGDQVIEFAPSGDSAGAGLNALKWTECPRPEGGFSITNETLKESPDTGSGEMVVLSGTDLEFNAAEVTGVKGEYLSGVELNGRSPWAYDWDLAGGVALGFSGAIVEMPWTLNNEFAVTPEANNAYLWPEAHVEAAFDEPGAFTETLKLVSDSGTFTEARVLRVVAPGKITDTKIAAGVSPTEGEAVTLKASATLPSGDKIKDYHWEFGDGEGEDSGEHAEVAHTYKTAGVYTVKLAVTDALGQTAEAEEVVTIAKAAVKEKTKETEKTTVTTSTTTTTTSTSTSTTTKATTKPLTPAQKLAAALKQCKKDKAKKKRAQCEKQAKAKYGPKPKKKSTKKK